jgi:hypothetical protein
MHEVEVVAMILDRVDDSGKLQAPHGLLELPEFLTGQRYWPVATRSIERPPRALSSSSLRTRVRT